MAKNPSMRPRSALEFAQALQSVEQEQRFATTEITVGGVDEPARPSERRRDPEDATKLRAPARIVAQPPRTPSTFAPATRPAPTASEPPTTARPLRPIVESGHPDLERPSRARIVANPEAPSSTVRRPVAVQASPDDEVPDLPRRGLRPKTAAVVASSVILVAIVVGVLLASGGGDAKKGDTIPTTKATDQTSAPVDVAVPHVTATYRAATKTVVFTWRVPGAKKGDSYIWTAVDAPNDRNRVTSRTLSIKTASPTKVCIRVAYLPAGASATGQSSEQVCGPRI
jgi:hypothetical protein